MDYMDRFLGRFYWRFVCALAIAGLLFLREYKSHNRSGYRVGNAEITPLSFSEKDKEKARLFMTSNLGKARSRFNTRVSYTAASSSPPDPATSLFQAVTYPSAVGNLAAYITPDPQDGKQHPAIIWITGGDCNSIGDVWSNSSPENDQTAHAYRDAGIVMMFPSLRGGNNNPGQREGFYGEVDDVLSAFDYLSRLPYVDRQRIYLGGHSTGGTLVLLTAEIKSPFRAVFAFGPSSSVTSYRKDIIPVDFAKYDEKEVLLRSPGFWIESVQAQLYVIEGTEAPSNIEALRAMEQAAQNANGFIPQEGSATFLSVPGANHFSVLSRMNEKIAKSILHDYAGRPTFQLYE